MIGIYENVTLKLKLKYTNSGLYLEQSLEKENSFIRLLSNFSWAPPPWIDLCEVLILVHFTILIPKILFRGAKKKKWFCLSYL